MGLYKLFKRELYNPARREGFLDGLLVLAFSALAAGIFGIVYNIFAGLNLTYIALSGNLAANGITLFGIVVSVASNEISAGRAVLQPVET